MVNVERNHVELCKCLLIYCHVQAIFALDLGESSSNHIPTQTVEHNIQDNNEKIHCKHNNICLKHGPAGVLLYLLNVDNWQGRKSWKQAQLCVHMHCILHMFTYNTLLRISFTSTKSPLGTLPRISFMSTNESSLSLLAEDDDEYSVTRDEGC